MKKFFLPSFAIVCMSLFVVSSCTLDKEPDIPVATNLVEPVFNNVSVSADTNLFFRVTATLTSLGNLNIQEHGWVWSEAPVPTLEDNIIALGPLTITTFTDSIMGLDVGKPYYLRPYVINSADTVYYGSERCSFVGVNFTINTDREIFKGAIVHFINTSVGNHTYLWDFGDGTTSTEVSPVHQYDTLGKMTVRLVASTNGCIAIRSKTEFLNIIPDPLEKYWVAIPGGTFMMGCTAEQDSCSNDEYPVHEVTLSPFLIGKTEITQRQWLAVTGNNPSYHYECGLDCPVETVSWNLINDQFIPALYRKTGRIHRLPTEAEWEYAARGGLPPSNMKKYAGSDDLNSVGWYFGNSGSLGGTHPVAQKDPNGYGLYDMSGNVKEWCSDQYSDVYYTISPSTNPTGPSVSSGDRVFRGGASVFPDFYCRTSVRDFNQPFDKGSDGGLRLARD